MESRPPLEALAWMESVPATAPTYPNVARPLGSVLAFRVRALGPKTWSVTGRLTSGLPALSIAETVSAWFWPSRAPGTLKGMMSRLIAGGSGTLMVLALPAMRSQGVDSLPWQTRSKPRVLRIWCVSV